MRLLTLSYLVLFFLFLSPVSTFGLECGEPIPPDTPEGVLRDYVADCQGKIDTNQGQQQTLAAAIAYLDGQIGLTQAKIAATTTELTTLETIIADLSGKIESVEYSLTDLTKFFVERVRLTYMYRGTWATQLLSQTSGLPSFVRNLGYAKKVRDHDQALLLVLEKARLDYDTQKQQKEEKQTEVQALKTTLDAQKATLDTQKAAKNKLLVDTKNDEKRYSQLMSTAQSQLAAFRRFVSSQGGASILNNQTKCDGWGCYYNQRDGAWGNQTIGLSPEIMREVGCLVTSMAMIASHYNRPLTPGEIAGSSTPFWGSTAYMNQGSWSVNGVTMTRTRLGSSLAALDEELAAGRPVVVGIYGGPDHFLVIKEKVGNDYRVHDPFPENGSDLMFTSKYPLSAITAVDRVTVE